MNPKPLAYTAEYNGIVRVIATEVHIFVPNKYNPAPAVGAIWDTGATGSSITIALVKKLNLLPTGRSYVNTTNGSVWKSTYTVDIGLPNGYIVPGVVVSEVDALSGGIDVLIGMDIIRHGDFSITNHNGKTVMSFRMPSLHTVDYTQEPLPKEKPTEPKPKVGRNDKCPCGSNKKYKNCHGQ